MVRLASQGKGHPPADPLHLQWFHGVCLEEGQEGMEFFFHDPGEDPDSPRSHLPDHFFHETDKNGGPEVCGDDVELSVHGSDSAFQYDDIPNDSIDREVPFRFRTCGPVDIHGCYAGCPQPMRRNGENSRPRSHIQNRLSARNRPLERNETSFRRAVAARAECAVEIEEDDGSVPVGRGNGHPFSRDQQPGADGLGFPAPENAPLPLVLDKRLQESMACVENVHYPLL